MPFVPPPNTSPRNLEWLRENWDRLTDEERRDLKSRVLFDELMRGNVNYYETYRDP